MEPRNVVVVTWNILAECYAYSTIIPEQYLSWNYRLPAIVNFLRQSNADIICLQEVDRLDALQDVFSEMGMKVLFNNRPTKPDGCVIAFNMKRFRCSSIETIMFNDISNRFEPDSSEFVKYTRHNIALLAKLERICDGYEFVVTCGHLYWNPRTPEVKLAQTQYWISNIERIAKITNATNNTYLPVIMAGDFNSLPGSETYLYATQALERPNLHRKYLAIEFMQYSNESVKFLCDATLGKLCRWLRLLGIDATKFDIDAQEKRTTESLNRVFAQAWTERRVIITTSRTMKDRIGCPPCLLIKTKSMKDALVNICRKYNLKLDKSKFLTVCGKCGSDIELCAKDDPRLESKNFPMDRETFICSKCYQVYWWSEREESSPARAMKMAETLFAYVENSFEQCESSKSDMNALNDGLESLDLNSKFEVRSNFIANRENSEATTDGLLTEVNKPLSSCDIDKDSSDSPVSEVITSNNNDNENEKDHIFLQSSFAAMNTDEPDTTNWSDNFSGTLDYIFLSKDITVQTSECFPRIGIDDGTEERPLRDVVIDKCLPNYCWPSDHFMLRAVIELPN